MLAHVLITAGIDPSFIVGATCDQIGGGSRVGAERIPAGSLAGAPGVMVAEACEYNRSFHSHRPTLALINNIEEDHLDFYTGGLDEIIASFNAFAGRLPDRTQGGRLLIAHDGAHRRRVTAGLSCAVSSFGFAALADYRVQFDAQTRECSVSHRGAELLRWTSRLLGDHNVLNAAAAGILATWVGADRPLIESGLSTFGGVDRRLQHMGDRTLADGGTVRVYDDYGHHPTEVDATLRAIRAGLTPTRLVCVFQPHQHSRTRHLLDEFAQSFGHADIVLVPDIYFVRDSAEDAQSVSSADLVAKLRERGAQAWHVPSFDGIVNRLDEIAQDGDLVVVMGAGPVWEVGRDWLARAGKPATGSTP
jgi:UDP-N-acetylmuramate--alanine ligase